MHKLLTSLFLLTFSFVCLAAFAAERKEVQQQRQSESLLAIRPQELFETLTSPQARSGFSSIILDSLPLRKRRAVRSTPVPTPETSLVVLGPDADGNYHVPFSSWGDVPANTDLVAYWLDASGQDHFMFGRTTSAPGFGYAAWLLGGYDWSQPLPKGAVGFKVRFSGARNLTVFAIVGDLPPDVTISPGMIFVGGGYNPTPVMSLNGEGVPVINGVVVPPPECTGDGVIVAVCHLTLSSPVVSQCQGTMTTVPAAAK